MKIINHVYIHFNHQLSGIPTPLNVDVQKETSSAPNPVQQHVAPSTLAPGEVVISKALLDLISSALYTKNEAVSTHTHTKIMKNKIVHTHTYTYIHIYTHPHITKTTQIRPINRLAKTSRREKLTTRDNTLTQTQSRMSMTI